MDQDLGILTQKLKGLRRTPGQFTTNSPYGAHKVFGNQVEFIALILTPFEKTVDEEHLVCVLDARCSTHFLKFLGSSDRFRMHKLRFECSNSFVFCSWFSGL